MARYWHVALGALLVVAALIPGPAMAADRYEVIAEYNGPFFHVVNAPLIEQLVDDPLGTFPFENVYSVAVSRETGGRIMNYVLDSGNHRILGYEFQVDIGRASQSSVTWTNPRVAAGQWDGTGINLAEWGASSAKWVIPYSEVFRVNGETWDFVADISGYAASEKVYTIDYDDAVNAPELRVPTGALTETDEWTLFYCISNYRGGATAAFGLGEIDAGNSDGATVADVRIDQTAPVAKSFQDLRSIFTIPNQTTATTDELWLVDATDSSVLQDEELMVYTVTQATGVEAFLEAYDDVLADPRDVYVARTTGDTYTDPTYTSAVASPFYTGAAIVDANQVTGHTYYVDMTDSLVTITDVNTGRVLVSGADKSHFVTGTNTCYVFPGLGVDWDATVADDTDGYVTTQRAIPSRYAFVCDRGNDRIKVIGVGNISTTVGDDLPGDAHTCAAQPTGAGTVGATQDQDYRFDTPGTVPLNWKTGTVARPIKQGSLETLTADPAGTPVVWTRIDDLATATPTDKVFQLDWWEGAILFGDGLHGEIPPAATTFACTYVTTPDVMRFGETGSGDGQFINPEGVCAAWNSGLQCFVVYVADTGNNRIQKLHFYPEDTALNTPPRMEFIASWSQADGEGELLSGPHDIDVETNGVDYFIAVSDLSDRILVFKDSGFRGRTSTPPDAETLIGGTGNEVGYFGSVAGLDLIRSGGELEIYAADGARNVVTKFVLAPQPAVALVFTGGSALPNSFPPTGSYPVSFTVTNAPPGAYVDLAYSTSSDLSQTALIHPCVAAGTVTPDDSPVTWSFATSPQGTPADGTYYLIAYLYDESDNLLASDVSGPTELLTINSQLVTALQVRDRFDGDPTLLIAPNQTRTIALELTYPESVIGASFAGTFPADMLEVLSIVPGPGWEGTGYIQHVWNATYDNDAGTYAVFTSVTGAPLGLTGSGSHAMAFVNVRPKAASLVAGVQRARSGGFTLNAAQSQITQVSGGHPSGWVARPLDVKVAYVGDIANATAGTDSIVPYLQPNPDGYMTFADQMAFTLGWNGAGHVQDPIADMGPVTGSAPELVPAPDGKWNLEDLMAFTSNWSWFGDNGYATPTAFGAGAPLAFSPLGTEVQGDASVTLRSQIDSPLPGQELKVEIVLRDVTELTGAMVRVTYDPLQLTLAGTERGAFLASNGALAMLNTIEREGTCEICLTRLDRERPGVSGGGVLATLTFHVITPPESGLHYAYDLRDCCNQVIARGTADYFTGAAGDGVHEVVLCQNYPNPLRPSTNIVFSLPVKSEVDLALYDVGGRRVRTLVSGMSDAGLHVIDWDGCDASGARVGSGVYFYKLRAGELTLTRKLVVTR